MALCLLVSLISGCVNIRPTLGRDFGDDGNLPDELRRVLRDYETAWAAKDAAALAELFADDGFVLSNHRPPVRGRTHIEKHYQGAGGPLALRATAWRTRGDLAFIIGEYDQDETFANPGKFTLTLVRDDNDRWLIFSDMDNGNTPPRPPASAPSAPQSP